MLLKLNLEPSTQLSIRVVGPLDSLAFDAIGIIFETVRRALAIGHEGSSERKRSPRAHAIGRAS